MLTTHIFICDLISSQLTPLSDIVTCLCEVNLAINPSEYLISQGKTDRQAGHRDPISGPIDQQAVAVVLSAFPTQYNFMHLF